MTTPVYRLITHGDPAPKGRVKCVGRNGMHQIVWNSDAAGKAWRKHLTAAVEALATHTGTLDGPIAAGLLHVLPRGKTVTRQLPHVKGTGDVDKHARMSLDALTDGAAIGDDSQVVLLIAAKVYEAEGRPPGLHVYLAPGPGRHRRILDTILATAPELDY